MLAIFITYNSRKTTFYKNEIPILKLESGFFLHPTRSKREGEREIFTSIIIPMPVLNLRLNPRYLRYQRSTELNHQ